MAKKIYNASSASLADFKQLSLLGEGAYSSVYKVLRLADREMYALKKVKLPSLSDKEKQNALNEVRLLASVRHENISAYKEAFFDDKTRCLCIVIEYADSGDLFQQITKCQKERTHPKEADLWRYLQGMCHGLKALHDMRILHRDLKCANVFLHCEKGEIVAKLGDFNVSKVAKRGLCMTQTGTPYYASPEVWRDMPYDAKSDMWSLGCVLYEMVALRPPFRAEDMEGLYRKVLRGQYPRIPPHFSNDLSEVIGVLLQVNPRHRPSIDQLLQMPVMRRHAAPAEPETRAMDLLSTIKLPKNAIDISGCLPGPQYDLMYGQIGSYGALPPSQESAGDIAGGTAKLPPRIVPARGQPLQQLPPPSEDDSASRLDVDNSYQDSLDAYLSSPAPPSQSPAQPRESQPVHRAAPPMPAAPPQGHQGRQGHLAQQAAAPVSALGHLPQIVQDRPGQERDSLDSYVQRQPRAARQQRVSNEYADYSMEDSSQQPIQQQQQPQQQRMPRQNRAAPASPAPSSQVHRQAPLYGQNPAHAAQPVYGGQQYRQPRQHGNYARSQDSRASQNSAHGQASASQDRRPMANYARPQYAMGGAAVAQAPPPRQATGGGSGLRLPRIFTKAS